MVDCVVLTAHGRTSTTTLPYDAMDAKGWHRRARVVYDAPPSLVASYLPLASKVFATQYRGEDEVVPHEVASIVGDLGLSFALDEARQPVVSVEAIALHQLLVSAATSIAEAPAWMSALEATWTSGQCLTILHSEWRGCVSEHRLWSAYLLRHGEAIKTPYSKPTVRAWVPDAVLDDLIECVGAATVDRVATTISDLGFDGAPDLVLWTSHRLWLVEVKSASDRLRDTQSQMLKELSRLDHVTCSICCPEAARKRMLATMMADESTDEE